MGGNALKSETRRMNRAEYDRVLHCVQQKFLEQLNTPTHPIPFYQEKQTFGDLDLVFDVGHLAAYDQERGEHQFSQIQGFVQDMFFSRSEHINSDTFSFEYRENAEENDGFQVDLIGFPKHDIKTAIHYYSYNDLGNLIGRVAESFGFKYGHTGLLFRHTDGTNLVDTITVSKDNNQILNFLGYDHGRFDAGFNNLEDIFSFVKSSPYFHSNYYLLENRNHKARTRDKKRTTYSAFLTTISKDLTVSDPKPRPTLNDAFNFFPTFKTSLEISAFKFEQKKQLKGVFNGKVVGEITGLAGEDLAKFMNYFKNQFSGPEDMLEALQKITDMKTYTSQLFEMFQKQRKDVNKNKIV